MTTPRPPMPTWTTARTIAPDLHLRFTWHGGAYIEITAPGFSHPSEVINVWDYEADKPRIERTQDAFEAKVDSWMVNYDEEYGAGGLLHDVTENWS